MQHLTYSLLRLLILFRRFAELMAGVTLTNWSEISLCYKLNNAFSPIALRKQALCGVAKAQSKMRSFYRSLT